MGFLFVTEYILCLFFLYKVGCLVSSVARSAKIKLSNDQENQPKTEKSSTIQSICTAFEIQHSSVIVLYIFSFMLEIYELLNYNELLQLKRK